MVAFLSNGRKSRTDIDAYGRDNRKLVKLRLCVCVKTETCRSKDVLSQVNNREKEW